MASEGVLIQKPASGYKPRFIGVKEPSERVQIALQRRGEFAKMLPSAVQAQSESSVRELQTKWTVLAGYLFQVMPSAVRGKLGSQVPRGLEVEEKKTKAGATMLFLKVSDGKKTERVWFADVSPFRNDADEVGMLLQKTGRGGREVDAIPFPLEKKGDFSASLKKMQRMIADEAVIAAGIRAFNVLSDAAKGKDVGIAVKIVGHPEFSLVSNEGKMPLFELEFPITHAVPNRAVYGFTQVFGQDSNRGKGLYTLDSALSEITKHIKAHPKTLY